jgi:hypothetical protein
MSLRLLTIHYLHPHITYFSVSPNILLSTLFSNTLKITEWQRALITELIIIHLIQKFSSGNS